MSGGFTIVGVILGILGILVAVSLWVLDRRRRRDKPKDPVHTIRFWRARSFEQALQYLSSYTEALPKINPAGNASPKVIASASLERWAFHILLTAASMIGRYSQGKANLFVVNEILKTNPHAAVALRSQYFVGAFPLWQLQKKGVFEYRDMPVGQEYAHGMPVAGTAALNDRICLDPLGVEFLSSAEENLRTSHILAIPICEGIDAVQPGHAAVITVDLRLPWWIRALDKIGLWHGRRQIMSRAARVQEAARKVAAILPSAQK